jgi:FkbM family methyltransferase
LDTYRADLLKKDDTVIDLGAGIGDFSVLASRKVGPNGKVIALEPNAEDYEMLKMNIERNGCATSLPLISAWQVNCKPARVQEIHFKSACPSAHST